MANSDSIFKNLGLEGKSNPIAWIVSRLVTILVVIVLLSAFFSSYSIVEPGNTGVVFNIWTGSLRTTGQGLVWRLPWVTRVQSYPTALRTYTMVMRSGEGSDEGDDSIDLPTREGQHIRQDVSITYNTSEAKAAEVFKNFRGADVSEIESTYIRRTTITIAQNVAGQMSLTEVISDKRTDFQNAMQASLQVELEKMGFNLDKVNLGASHLPDVIEKQMQQKIAVQQEAEQAQYELQKQVTLAKATVAQAQGEAEALLVKAKAQSEANHLLQASITSTLVKYKAIEKWDGVLPKVTGGNTPFIDLKSMAAADKTADQ